MDFKSELQSIKTLPANEAAELLIKKRSPRRKELLKKLKTKRLMELLHFLDPDDVASLLRNVSKIRRKRIIDKLNKNLQGKVQFLLRFAPSTAAGMMNLDYIEVEKDSTFGSVLKAVKKHEKKTGKFPTILVVEDELFKGELPAHAFLSHGKREKISKYIRKVPSIRYDKDDKEILKKFRSHKHDKVIVKEEDNSVLGIIYSDDILSIVEKQSSQTLNNFGGVKKEEDILDSPLTKVRHRYKWLILNLLSAFIAATVVGFFQDTISSFALLAAYMPIVAGISGNGGIQTFAVLVRGITMKEISFSNAFKPLMKEMFAGMLDGVIVGAIVTLIATVFNQALLLGLLAGISLIINLTMSAFLGTFYPLLLSKMGKDPASSAGVFITSGTDTFGYFVFLGLATIFL